MEPRALLRALFDAALEAATPRPEWFAGLEPPRGRTIVVGAGKAAASMARAFEAAWPHPVEGLVVTRYGHGRATRRVEVVEAAHPLPDAAGMRAAERILDAVGNLTPDDLVVALMSGGGSALLTLPAEGVTLGEKRALADALLGSGATIGEINAVRKALSRIKGGRLLAAAQPARVVTYVVSDVPGDDPAVVASGPTVPDDTPPGTALAVLDRHGIAVPAPLRNRLARPGKRVAFGGVDVRVVASAGIALDAAARKARTWGLDAHVLSDAIEGEAREVAKVHAALARFVADRNAPFRAPCVLLSGGETTVTVGGGGRGGRNVEFLAALAQSLDGHPRVWALAADTDGADGTEPVAGAFIDPTSAARAGADLGRCLAGHDAHTLFERLDDRLATGPTLTNVADFRALLIL